MTNYGEEVSSGWGWGAVGVTERSDREESQTVGVCLLPRRDRGIAACLAALGEEDLGGRSH